VPGHWDVVQFKKFVVIQNGSDHKHVEQPEGYPVLGSGGVFAYASDYLYDGESVLLGRKGTIDKPLHITGRFWTVDTMYWTKISPDASGRFTFYTALAIPFDFYSTNTALPSMTKGALSSHRVTCPPLAEQIKIAAFLDRETAKIDALVAEQRRLMALLKEKRQAVISHAVTRGLNPYITLKTSGIEWLGDVPEHWEVTKLSRITTKIGDGLHGTPEYVDESEFYFINGNNLANGEISITDTTRCVSEAERDKHDVKLNQTTVFLSINGTIGNFALYRGESVMLGKSAAYINCHEKVLRDYLCWCLQSTGTRRYFDFSVTGTTIFNLSLESIRKMPVVLPSYDEQVEIGIFLAERTGEYDRLLQEAQRAINLLQERRTALIAAAVTGQIDVRDKP
jgi:type I restriction enzyme S subunit